MKLTHIRVKDLRSFSGEHEFDVSNGVNYVVGPNNCGKSNLIRALELALDPESVYSPARDRPTKDSPAVGAPPSTRIALTFQVGKSSPEKTLLSRARAYELAIRKARNASTKGFVKTYAADNEIRMVTTFGARGTRQTSFQAKGFGAASLPSQSAEHTKLEAQFRSVVRFAVIHSGQDLESLLKGKFREILQLVISDHLGSEIAKADAARDEYLTSLQTQLLEPLRGLIQERVGEMFSEISNAELVPAVPTVYDTLSSVEIRLGDAVTTPLSAKGTGIRGAVLVSMLQYLAEQSKRSLVLAVEEPEAFLHPAGQEDIRDQLEELATRTDVSLVVTTHSPYVISRRSTSRITELRKRPDGFTEKAASVRGNEKRAQLLGALYRDAGLAHVLERSLEIPAGTEVVVVTEGYTDGLFINQCCTAANRHDLVEGIHFIPAGNASNVVPQAILAEAATEAPVIALLDFDDHGRAAADKLKSFNWEPSRRILTLNKWDGACTKQHDVEIEDLLPRRAVEQLVEQLGEDAAIDGKEKCGGSWHLRVSKTWKEHAISKLADYLWQVPDNRSSRS
ncbi:AAA family ATPase [Gordonia rubripertincta]|uniref:ATP-dependent nuclease n=1 Tax=Gordonia rubripertincta TaxID=36822 RepID=UPI00117C65A8|nr:AAA family ATPase [Gordonia rubripertincta]TSD92899.1 AAA family ATPase [Gordonia rubripertincta]